MNSGGQAVAKRWFQEYGGLVYLTIAGLVLLWLSWRFALRGSDAAAASLTLMGGGALLVAPFAARIYGRLKIGPVEMTLRDRAVAAIVAAPPENVDGILPLLESQQIAVERIPLPATLGGYALTDPDLAFLRPELDVSVIAVQLPGDSLWRVGGEISDMILPGGALLLAAGPRDSLRRLRQLFAKSA